VGRGKRGGGKKEKREKAGRKSLRLACTGKGGKKGNMVKRKRGEGKNREKKKRKKGKLSFLIARRGKKRKSYIYKKKREE